MAGPPPIDLAVWSAVAGLGVFHGLNPAMGWLFAVAQGMHHKKRSAVYAAVAPIAFGHAASVAVVMLAFLTLGLTFDRLVVTRIAAGVLLAWGLWLIARRHRPRWQFGMKTSLAGLGLWSFLMAGAHGGGLMLIPILGPLCLAQAPGQRLVPGSLAASAGLLAVHTAAMLLTIAAISLVVYEWAGLAFLRWGWINLDLVWAAALIICGGLLVVL